MVDVLGTAIGAVHLAVAVVVARRIRGAAHLFPWLAVLATFFAVRGVDRITESLAEERRLRPLPGEIDTRPTTTSAPV